MEPEGYIPVALTDHTQYVKLLAALQPKTAYILLVQITGEDLQDSVAAKAISCMDLIEKSAVNRWPGTIRSGKGAMQYLFGANNQFFTFLKTFPSFFFNRKDPWGCDTVEETAFGQDDIAFLDNGRHPLFYTTTHEGYAYAAPGLVK